jgi:phage-related protein/predicted  nucleic acid-binding Zn-ribbon protein
VKADGTIIIDTAIQDDGFEAGTKELENAARRVAQKVSSLGNKIKVAINKQLNSFVKLNEAYARQEEKVNELRKAVEAYANQKIPTQEYREIQAQIDEARKKMIGLINAQERYLATGGKQNSNVYHRRQYDIQELANTIKYAEGELRDLEETGKAFTLGNNTKKAADATKKLQSEEEKLNDMNRRLNTSYASLENRVQEYTSSAAGSSKTTRNISRSVSGLASGISNAGKKIQRFTVSAGKAVKGLAAAMLGLNKNTNRAQMSIGRMLAMSIMFSAVFRLISAVTGGIGEGMSNLAQYSDQTNQSISTLMSSLTRLKNSFATAFAPILNVVAPALTAFIDLISRAITYVGMLIAALTGQDSFVRAVGVQEDYAGSLEDTAGAAQDAEKALNGYMSPLDKINRYEDGRNNSGSGSSLPGYVAPTPGEMFETVPIESSIKGIADKIKKLIQSQDWEGLGDYIASGINKGLQKVYNVISWDNVGPKITAFVDAFAGTFNSLVDNLNWDLMGRTIGAGVNTLVNTLNRLIEGIDWTNLGSKVAAGIYGLFDEINWTNLGNLIGNKFMILWDFLYGLVTDLDWGKIGTSVGNAINGAFEKIDYNTIGSTLARIFNGAVEFLKNATKTIKWKEIADNVASGINNALKEIDPAEAGKALSDFITSLLGMLLDIVQQTNWEEVGKAIGEFLGNIDWATIISQVGQIIWEAFSGMISGLFDTSGGKVVLAFVAGMTAIKGTFSLLTGSAGTLVSVIGTILSGLVNLMGPTGIIVVAVIAGIALIIKNFDSIKDAVSDIWGKIESQLKRTWKNIQTNAKSMVDGVKNVVQKGWNAVKTATSTLWNGVRTTISNVWNGIKTTANNAANGVKTTVQTAWNNIKSTTSTVWNSIKSSLSSIWNGLKSSANSAFSGLKNTFSNIWNGIKKTTASAWSGISKTLSSIWSGIRTTAGNVFRGITSTISNAWSSVKRTTSNIWSGIYNTVSSIWSKITGAISRIGSGIRSTFSGSSYSRSATMYSSLSTRPVPYLATGAVIPPNAPFVAVLGDQRKGTNIETPENLLRKIVREETGRNTGKGGSYRFTAQINRRTLFDEMINEAKMRRIQTGNNPFETI